MVIYVNIEISKNFSGVVERVSNERRTHIFKKWRALNQWWIACNWINMDAVVWWYALENLGFSVRSRARELSSNSCEEHGWLQPPNAMAQGLWGVESSLPMQDRNFCFCLILLYKTLEKINIFDQDTARFSDRCQEGRLICQQWLKQIRDRGEERD